MNQNKNTKLKISLLSTCLVSASLNAVVGLVPEMAAAFPAMALSTIELIATAPSLFQIVGVLGGQLMAKKLGYQNFVELGYYRMTRVSYGQKEVETFRKNILASVVPAVSRLRVETQRIWASTPICCTTTG